jgi:hypothetical protein
MAIGITFGMMFGGGSPEASSEWSTDDDGDDESDDDRGIDDDDDDDNDDYDDDDDDFDTDDDYDDYDDGGSGGIDDRRKPLWEPQAKQYSNMNLKEQVSAARDYFTATDPEQAELEEKRRIRNEKKRIERRQKIKEQRASKEGAEDTSALSAKQTEEQLEAMRLRAEQQW